MSLLTQKQSIFSEAAQLQFQNKPFAMATLLRTEGSTPRRSAKMIVHQNGGISGTIGGGAAEAYVIQEALDVIQSGESRIVSYEMNKKGTGVQKEYTGKIEVFIEYVGTVTRLVLIGAGHVNTALSKLAHHINFSITVIEDRPQLCTKERFPFAAQLSIDSDLGRAIDDVYFDENTFVVIATRSHETDAVALERLVKQKTAYLGMIGSRKKVSRGVAILREKGVPETAIGRIKAPIGLNIGAETPEEISISILAEILMIKHQADGRAMSLLSELSD